MIIIKLRSTSLSAAHVTARSESERPRKRQRDRERGEKSHLPAGLDTTEISCCGTADCAAWARHETGGCPCCCHPDDCTTAGRCSRPEPRPRRSSAEHCCTRRRPGCNSCSCEAGISCFAADSNTCRRHRRRPCFRPACTRADYCILRDLSGHLGPCRSLSGCSCISESIELTF